MTTPSLVLVPYLRATDAAGGREAASSRLDETVGLAKAINLDIAGQDVVPLAQYRPSTLLGSGKVEEIARRVEAGSVELVIIDHPLSPVQQRNLERAWRTKVIDRTGLILEIFGERAQTREGRLQVELAHLNYQKSRLVRSWTHLERQRGGFGFLGGPGETQIEADRRVIQERIARIESELEGVVKTRRLQRANRRRLPQPVVALVGYTNAGKTTLFNLLTRSDKRAEDLLFATLDPTLRRTQLPHGTEVVISDTVGFISDLPTMLVAAFRATLEEVTEADLILHVRDIAHPDTAAQAEDVHDVLKQLGVDANDNNRVIEIWNKIDLVPDLLLPSAPGQALLVSALKGDGISALLEAIETALNSRRAVYWVSLSGERLSALHRLYDIGEILDRHDANDGVSTVKIRVADKRLAAFLEAFPEAIAEGASAPAVQSA